MHASWILGTLQCLLSARPKRFLEKKLAPVTDETIAEIHAIRQEHAAHFDHDLNKIIDDLRAGQDKHTSEGWQVVPANVRKALNLKEGTALMLEVEGSGMRLTPIDETIDRLQALAASLLKGSPSLAEELIAERRQAAHQEFERGGGND